MGPSQTTMAETVPVDPDLSCWLEKYAVFDPAEAFRHYMVSDLTESQILEASRLYRGVQFDEAIIYAELGENVLCSRGVPNSPFYIINTLARLREFNLLVEGQHRNPSYYVQDRLPIEREQVKTVTVKKSLVGMRNVIEIREKGVVYVRGRRLSKNGDIVTKGHEVRRTAPVFHNALLCLKQGEYIWIEDQKLRLLCVTNDIFELSLYSQADLYFVTCEGV